MMGTHSKRAELLFHEIQSPVLRDQADVQLNTQMINVYANAQKWKSNHEYAMVNAYFVAPNLQENIEKAQKIYDALIEAKLEPTEHTKISLLRVYTEGKQLELSKKKFTELFPEQNSSIAWAAYIKLYGGNY